MKFSLLTSMLLATGIASTAVANAEEEISYEEAVAKCQEFVNDPQMVTIEFKVSCFDESYSWEVTDEVVLQQGNSGSLGHRILMKEKWYTPDFAIPIVHDPAQVSCPVLSQFRTARQAEIVVSCAELASDYSDPNALAAQCEIALQDATAQTGPTGQTFSPCEDATRR